MSGDHELRIDPDAEDTVSVEWGRLKFEFAPGGDLIVSDVDGNPLFEGKEDGVREVLRD